MFDLLTMAVHRPKIHESGRVIAFEVLDGSVWELSKLSNLGIWRLTKDGEVWVESTNENRIYEIFNGLKVR